MNEKYIQIVVILNVILTIVLGIGVYTVMNDNSELQFTQEFIDVKTSVNQTLATYKTTLIDLKSMAQYTKTQIKDINDYLSRNTSTWDASAVTIRDVKLTLTHLQDINEKLLLRIDQLEFRVAILEAP